MKSLQRIFAIVRKEVRQLRRDRLTFTPPSRRRYPQTSGELARFQEFYANHVARPDETGEEAEKEADDAQSN